ncbi:helix-turn-helix domain-containing protein [Chitinophaga nivalis]|uniref:AraC family transcriptional regulator n=1 Tax=Chitinophaga nivalis TaxID=2991709 RepID=A0ABT3IRY1_9BACT|nr:AraC family transcriptional regulator [Chitinophaga nivalis]MCW3463582.1 AraC family transcriptional regulator [Chitinophaga nivalis]MCW3486728.1 AraC family transcriptional regulator [Chitinophaga nivalis]
MPATTLFIKNMVCPRCIKVVRETLEAATLQVEEIELGKAVVAESLSAAQLQQVAAALETEGFLLIDDKKQQLVAAIKSIIVQTVHYTDLEEMKENFSTLLAGKLQKDYHYLSNLFSEMEGTTIEQYIIQQKIERVKELLVYKELSLSEISYQLGYSSVAHLSGQFKKVTGLTPSQFKQLQDPARIPLDKL